MARAYGKILLFGEHFAVYGKPCIATKIDRFIECEIKASDKTTILIDGILKEQIEISLSNEDKKVMLFNKIREMLSIKGNYEINLKGNIIPGAGMGSSAVLSVALIRTFSETLNLRLSEEEVNAFAYEGEKIFHNTPSGIDNTVVVYGKTIIYRKNGGQPVFSKLELINPVELLVVYSGKPGNTFDQVSKVRRLFGDNPELKEELLEKFDGLALKAEKALKAADLEELGFLFNENQEFLNCLGLYTPETERICRIAKTNCALGAKISGAGGGGIVLILPPSEIKLREALERELSAENFYHFSTLVK